METSVATIQAHWTTAPARKVPAVRRLETPPRPKDPFRLGFRERLITTPDGREVLEQIPLTPEDLIYPEEGDVVSQGMPHFSFLKSWIAPMVYHLEKRPGIVVTSDVNLVLRHDQKNCAPDIAVIEGDFDPMMLDGGINLRDLGGRLVFALEVVSTSEKEIENKDIEKNVDRYAAEGVREYFTIYPKLKNTVSDLVGRRLGPAGKYEEIAPDAQDRVASELLGWLFSIDAVTEQLVVEDAETGQRLRVFKEEAAARQQAEAERQQAEAARQRAEAARQEEAAARQQAEADLEQVRLEAFAQIERLKAQLRQSQKGGGGGHSCDSV